MLHNVEKTFLAICGQSGYNIANCVNRPEGRMEAPMTKWIKWIKWILIEVVLFALVLTGVMAVATLYVRPYMRANTALPKDCKKSFFDIM